MTFLPIVVDKSVRKCVPRSSVYLGMNLEEVLKTPSRPHQHPLLFLRGIRHSDLLAIVQFIHTKNNKYTNGFFVIIWFVFHFTILDFWTFYFIILDHRPFMAGHFLCQSLRQVLFYKSRPFWQHQQATTIGTINLKIGLILQGIGLVQAAVIEHWS